MKPMCCISTTLAGRFRAWTAAWVATISLFSCQACRYQVCRHIAGQSIEPEVYPRPDGSVYICGSPEYIALPDDPKTIQADPSSIEDLKEVARNVSSKLADAPLEVGQSCFLPVSPDGLPVMGRVPGVQGAYIASGISSLHIAQLAA